MSRQTISSMRASPVDPEGYWHGRVPTKEEAWAAFWEVIVPGLVQAYREGGVTAEELAMTREEHQRRLLAVRPQPSNREIRRWSARMGEPLAARGPIPRSARVRYLDAHISRTPHADGTLRPDRATVRGA